MCINFDLAYFVTRINRNKSISQVPNSKIYDPMFDTRILLNSQLRICIYGYRVKYKYMFF